MTVSTIQTAVVVIPTRDIVDWNSFHDTFKTALGFPEFYGRNMNAWIDCLTCADDSESGMVSNPVAPGELLMLEISDAADFKECCPDQYQALIECTAFVNYRRMEAGNRPVLSLLIAGSFDPS